MYSCISFIRSQSIKFGVVSVFSVSVIGGVVLPLFAADNPCFGWVCSCSHIVTSSYVLVAVIDFHWEFWFGYWNDVLQFSILFSLPLSLSLYLPVVGLSPVNIKHSFSMKSLHYHRVTDSGCISRYHDQHIIRLFLIARCHDACI